MPSRLGGLPCRHGSPETYPASSDLHNQRAKRKRRSRLYGSRRRSVIDLNTLQLLGLFELPRTPTSLRFPFDISPQRGHNPMKDSAGNGRLPRNTKSALLELLQKLCLVLTFVVCRSEHVDRCQEKVPGFCDRARIALYEITRSLSLAPCPLPTLLPT